MPRLLLHIGHGKTGTTWLQEAFRTGAGTLEAHGIRYPLVESAAGNPDYDERVPTGNAMHLLDRPDRLAARLRRVLSGPPGDALFSSEILFNRLVPMAELGWLPAAAREAGFDDVRLLLFTRAPVPLAASFWQQRVKGWQGETRDLDAFVAEWFEMPARIVALADRVAGTEGLDLALYNYDAHRGNLLAPVEDWLGLPPGTVAAPERGQVNRSLTRAETDLQLALNRKLGPSGGIFALRLTNHAPDVPPDPPRPSPEAAQAMLARLGPALDRLDALLPEGEALSRGLPEGAGPPAPLTPRQMEVIADGIAAYVSRPSWAALVRKLRRRLGR